MILKPVMLRHIIKHLLAGGLCVSLVIALCFVCLDTWYLDHFLPQTQFGSIDLANLNLDEALGRIETQDQPSDFNIVFSTATASISAQASQLGLNFDNQQVLKQHLSNLKQLPVFKRLKLIILSWEQPQHLSTRYRLDRELTTGFVTNLAKTLDQPGSLPQAHLGQTNSPYTLEIESGKLGSVVSVDQTVNAILDQVSTQGSQLTNLGTTTTISQNSSNQIIQPVIFMTDGFILNPIELLKAKQRASQLVGRAIKFETSEARIQTIFSDQDLISVLALPSGFNQTELMALVASKVEPINQSPHDAIFDFDANTLGVFAFQPDLPGIEVDQVKIVQQLISSTNQITTSNPDEAVAPENLVLIFDLPYTATPPQVSLESTNQLGIKELIGFGDSLYAHSIASRIHNVSHATALISGTLVAPGEEFSFNKTIGPVTRATGFKPAYIIQQGRTILGDGGGVCQVSTTLFRAALNAGLDITLRIPHSYRVGYYEQNVKPGIDATVYTGNTDLRFINDTNHYILIFGQTDSKNLSMYFEIYGTSDGRTTQIVDHKTWGSSPAPPAQYIDDPSLPAGVVKRVEHATAGLKTEFTNVIYDKNGQEIHRDTYKSNYIPWAAMYLVGTSQ
ncbi:VanW family protein [Patescibacteria group bacterium]|nr:VanW family protein [Patescibacteria group bacterium]